MKDLWYLVIIAVLIVIFMIVSMIAIDFYFNAEQCVLSEVVWCYSDWKCQCPNGTSQAILPCAMAASQACQPTKSTAFKKHIKKYPVLDPQNCLTVPPGQLAAEPGTAPCNVNGVNGTGGPNGAYFLPCAT
jgi:hypothetical protein